MKKNIVYIFTVISIFFPVVDVKAETVCECNYDIFISGCNANQNYQFPNVIPLDGTVTKNSLHERFEVYGNLNCITPQNGPSNTERATEYASLLETDWKGDTSPITADNCDDGKGFNDTGIVVQARCSQVESVPPPSPPPAPVVTPTPPITPSIPYQKADISVLNKLGTNSVPSLIGRGLKFFTGLFGSIALIMIIYGGLQIMFAAGGSERVKSGTKIILWASIGLVSMLASYVLVGFVFSSIM